MKKKPAASTFSDPQPLLHQGVGLTWPDAWVSQGTGPEPAEAKKNSASDQLRVPRYSCRALTPGYIHRGRLQPAPCLPSIPSSQGIISVQPLGDSVIGRSLQSWCLGTIREISGTKSRATARESRRRYRKKKWDQGTWMSKARAKLTRLTQGAGV